MEVEKLKGSVGKLLKIQVRKVEGLSLENLEELPRIIVARAWKGVKRS